MQEITMSTKAANRAPILEKLKRKEITQVEAAGELELTTRQVRRIMKAYLKQGVLALVHGNRGKLSNRAIPPKERDRILGLIVKQYADFGPTLAWEKLTELHESTLGLTCVRQLMIKQGLWQVKSHHYFKLHPLRARLPMNGQLIQADGSPFDWFEGRLNPVTGKAMKPCNLTVAIDDATGELKALYLSPQETTLAYFTALKPYFEREGKPLALYVDHDSIFTVNESDLQKLERVKAKIGELDPLTQFARAMEALKIKILLAPGPEAKGRVERVNQTLQDRLTKELRLRNICDFDSANHYLPEFRQWFNQKFAVFSASSINAHRPLLPTDNLDLVLAEQSHRTLSRNLTCQFDHVIYQVAEKKPGYTLRGALVTIIKDIQGKVTLLRCGRSLAYTTFIPTQRQPKLSVKQLDLVAKNPRAQTYWEQLTEDQWSNYALT
jgi:hypothetical protein